METILIGVAAVSALIAAYFSIKAYVLSLKKLAPRIRRLQADRDGISLELEAGQQPAQVRWVLVRSGLWLRPVRVKQAHARNWDGAQLFRNLSSWKLPLKDFVIAGKHGLAEGLIRLRLQDSRERPVRVIVLGRAGRYGELGPFAMQGRIRLAAPARAPQVTREAPRRARTETTPRRWAIPSLFLQRRNS